MGNCLEKKIKKKEMGEGANGNCQSQLTTNQNQSNGKNFL